MNGNKEVWVWAEQRNGKLLDVSLQLLGSARALGKETEGKIAAVLLGDKLKDLANELIAYGADKVYLISDPELEYYQSDAYTRLISELVLQEMPQIMLLGATMIGMDLAPAIAARVQTGLTAHCCDLNILNINGSPKLIATVPAGGEVCGWTSFAPRDFPRWRP